MLKIIETTADSILEQNPGVIVRYLLLRDVLKKSPENLEILDAKNCLDESQLVSNLAQEQHNSGSWGAFHSRNTKVKQEILTTEMGVERALALGLDLSHPILQKAHAYILGILEGKIPFPDQNEKNERWPIGMRLFLASTLARIAPHDPILDQDKQLWSEIARQTFQSGQYNEADEARAHAKLTGLSVKGTYLVFRNKYQINLLGTLQGKLPVNIEKALLTWLFEHPNGIGYLNVPLNREPPKNPEHFDRWLASLELLARNLPTWVNFAEKPVAWLLEQRNAESLWDFGPRPTDSPYLPLSDNWQDRRTRRFDWSTRILMLLKNYYDTLS